MAKSDSRKQREKQAKNGTGKKFEGRKGRGAGSDTHDKGGSIPKHTRGGRTGRDIGY